MPRTVHRYELERLNRFPYQLGHEGLSKIFPDRQVLHEDWLLRPGINADRDAAAANTYATATAQLNIDKNPHFEVLGTNATSATVTHEADTGLLLTTTTTASGDQVLVGPHQNSAVSKWKATTFDTSKQPTFEIVCVTDTAVTLRTIFAGLKLTNDPAVATDDDQAYFRYGGTGNWVCVTSRANVDVSTDSGIPVAVSTAYRLLIKVDSSRIPHFFINGVEVAGGVNNVNPLAALTASIKLIPFFGIQAGAAAAKAAKWSPIECTRKF